MTNESANVAMQAFMVPPLSYGTRINVLWRLSMFFAGDGETRPIHSQDHLWR